MFRTVTIPLVTYPAPPLCIASSSDLGNAPCGKVLPPRVTGGAAAATVVAVADFTNPGTQGSLAMVVPHM